MEGLFKEEKVESWSECLRSVELKISRIDIDNEKSLEIENDSDLILITKTYFLWIGFFFFTVVSCSKVDIIFKVKYIFLRN